MPSSLGHMFSFDMQIKSKHLIWQVVEIQFLLFMLFQMLELHFLWDGGYQAKDERVLFVGYLLTQGYWFRKHSTFFFVIFTFTPPPFPAKHAKMAYSLRSKKISHSRIQNLSKKISHLTYLESDVHARTD